MGKVLIVGFGPGSHEHITSEARAAIGKADVIVGYRTYVELVKDLVIGKRIISTGMTEEISRAKRAIEIAREGKTVAVISSGDAGVYGMAGLIYDVLREEGWKPGDGLEVHVIPGVSALNSVAALLGAPLMHDFAAISLSDLMTPWEVIRKRLDCAAQADFVIVLYNPKSGRRTHQIAEAQEIFLKHRKPETPVGIVKSAFRDMQHKALTTLSDMLNHEIGMLTTIIIGNSQTYIYEGLMITPRGYQNKYDLAAKDRVVRAGQTPGVSLR